MAPPIKGLAWATPQPSTQSRSLESTADDLLQIVQTNLFAILQLHQVVLEGEQQFAQQYRDQHSKRSDYFDACKKRLVELRKAPKSPATLIELEDMHATLQLDQARLEIIFFRAARQGATFYSRLRRLVSRIGYPLQKTEAEAALSEVEAMQLEINRLLQTDKGTLNPTRALQIIVLHSQQYLYAQQIGDNSRKSRSLFTRVERVITILSGLVLLAVLFFLIRIGWMNRTSWEAFSAYTILGIPTVILLWSLLGSLAAIVHRFYKGSAYAFNNTYTWPVIRSLMGVLVAAVVYMALYSIFYRDGDQINPFIPVLLAFFVGYSDKFSLSLMQSIQEVLGTFFNKSEEEEEPLTEPPTTPDPPVTPESPTTSLDVPPKLPSHMDKGEDE